MVIWRSGGVRGHGPYDSIPLELWPGLVLHCMGEVDFHVFWEYWKLTSSPNTSKFVFGPPDWSSDFFESQGTISGAIKPFNFQKDDPPKHKEGEPGKPTKTIVFENGFIFYAFFGSHVFLCLF